MRRLFCSFSLVMPFMLLFHCQRSEKGDTQKQEALNIQADSVAIREAFSVSPVFSPTEAINMMEVEQGFEVKLVAAEPLVTAPVAMAFDHKGRIWVVEMETYMPDIEGRGEGMPTGTIAILEDANKDGQFDTRKIFLDSLVLPRAICLIEDGILVAEPPNLWFYEINNDKAGERVLVDGEYAEGGNVEHKPNGLFRALDNWIYNAKSDKRYRKKGDQWLIERTHFRGQWGISQDNEGRLYHNDNSTNLRGEFFAPGLGATNENQDAVAGFNERVVPDNRVYPARPTPGVNRGYLEGFLDDSLRLVEFTAACGPLIYRGDLFGKSYGHNAFVAEPAANLIKRNILDKTGFTVRGVQAYEGKEFLASRDERFRPVSLYNGPDGALYIVDMYRGIIQHKTYLTPYLTREILRRDLSKPLSAGRIYKVLPLNSNAQKVEIPENPQELLALLDHPNGWVRDQAQQILIDRKFTQAIPALREALHKTDRPILVTHALWTLEGLETQGLDALSLEEVLPLLKQSSWNIRMQALSVLPSVIHTTNFRQLALVLEEMVEKGDSLAAPYVAFLTSHIEPFDQKAAKDLLHKVVKKYPDDQYVAAAAISSLEDREEIFQKEIAAYLPDTTLAIHQQLKQVLINIKEARASQDMETVKKSFPKGSALYASNCQTCHGEDGNGIQSLAPPLNQSEWVTGDKNKLISIVLFGLTGPVSVKGHVYEAPEITSDMPGIGHNQDISDAEVAELLSFIRQAWKNNATNVSAEEVSSVREQLKGREKAFTVEELNELYSE